MNKTGLYIHVPFCAVKCPYCDFYSKGFSRKNAVDYSEAVIRNIKYYINNDPALCFDTVYFGGGTPSLMPSEFFYRIMDTLSERISSDNEISVEVNPKTVNYDKLKEYISFGINRLSVGVQSAVDSELEGLGRRHTFSDAEKTFDIARKAGFENISADLMIGIKGQSKESLMYSCEKIAGLSPEHISAYMLIIEPGTEFYSNTISALVPDEDETADMYLSLVKKLDDLGYHQYEISNFSKEGYESRHNLKYWRCEEYIGIGPSAHSYFRDLRYEVPRDLSEFILSDVQREEINEKNPGSFFERGMLKLRLTEGFCLDEYPEQKDRIIRNSTKFIKAGLVQLSDNVINLTPEGFLVSNYLISEIFS